MFKKLWGKVKTKLQEAKEKASKVWEEKGIEWLEKIGMALLANYLKSRTERKKANKK